MRYLRYCLTFILIIVAVFVIYPKFKGLLYEVPSLFKEVNKPFLFFLFLFQIINYLGDAWLSQILLSISGSKVKLKDTLKVSILGVAGNHVFQKMGNAVYFFCFIF